MRRQMTSNNGLALLVPTLRGCVAFPRSAWERSFFDALRREPDADRQWFAFRRGASELENVRGISGSRKSRVSRRCGFRIFASLISEFADLSGGIMVKNGRVAIRIRQFVRGMRFFLQPQVWPEVYLIENISSRVLFKLFR